MNRTPTMNIFDLNEYVYILADMENNIFLMQTLINKLKNHSESLGRPKVLTKPAEPKKEIIHYSGPEGDASYIGVLALVVLGGLLLLCGIKLVNSSNLLAYLPGIFLFIMGIVLIIVGFVSWSQAVENEKKEKQATLKYSKDMDRYKTELSLYNKSVLDDKARLEKEEKERAFINFTIQTLESRLAQSEERLQEMYNLGLIYPKYQNMVMINYIYELLESGICSVLQGPIGAYNVLETNMRLDKIITKLDLIITHLESIKENQYMIYTAIVQGNKVSDDIFQSTVDILTKNDYIQGNNQDNSQEFQKLQETSRLAEYNLERINKEQYYMNRMKYFAEEYNVTTFNQLT